MGTGRRNFATSALESGPLVSAERCVVSPFRRVFVKTLKDVTFAVDCDETSTVLEVKHRVAEQDAQWDVLRQR